MSQINLKTITEKGQKKAEMLMALADYFNLKAERELAKINDPRSSRAVQHMAVKALAGLPTRLGARGSVMKRHRQDLLNPENKAAIFAARRMAKDL